MDLHHKIRRIIDTVPGWCTYEKACVLAELVTTYKPKIYVEIGVFGGRSLFPIALAMKEINFGQCIGIDPWTKDACMEDMHEPANRDWWSNVNLDSIYDEFVRNFERLDIARRCGYYRAKSADLVGDFTDGSIGMLHIDGNHSSKPAMEDARLWLPKVEPNGVIVLDDINWAECGVDTVQPVLKYLLDNGCVMERSMDNYAILRNKSA